MSPLDRPRCGLCSPPWLWASPHIGALQPGCCSVASLERARPGVRTEAPCPPWGVAWAPSCPIPLEQPLHKSPLQQEGLGLLPLCYRENGLAEQSGDCLCPKMSNRHFWAFDSKDQPVETSRYHQRCPLPGGPVVKAPSFHCRECRFDLWWGD